MTRALRLARDRGDALALVAILVGIQFLPRSVPLGIYGLGVVSGASLALQSIGVVLVYRSNRIINFAQVQVGAVAAVLFTTLVRSEALFRLVRTVCPPCLERVTPRLANLNYVLSLVAAMVFAVLIAWAVYTFVVKRFARAPRLVLTVATIFLAQLLGGIQGVLPGLLITQTQIEQGTDLTGAAPPPINWTFTMSPARFDAQDILTLLVTAGAVCGLLVYMKRTSTGIAIRASAENEARAGTLGVNVAGLVSRVWIVAGALSGVAAVLASMSFPPSAQATLNVGSAVRILAAAVIGRMVSLPMTAAAAVVLGVLDQAVFWAYGSRVVLDAILLVIVGGVLLLQRAVVSRAEIEQASAWRASREVRPIPRELRPLPAVRTWLRTGAVAGAAVALLFPWAMSPSQTGLASFVMIFAMIGLSLLVLTGWAGQISLGQFGFAAVGGYVAALLAGVSLLGLVLGAVAGGAVALVIGLPALKLRGLHLAIMTLAFSLATSAVLVNPTYLGARLPRTLARPGVLGMSLDDERVFYYFTLGVLALVVAAVAGVRRSRTARALIAARDNELQAQIFGVDVVRLRLVAFSMSGTIAALAGGLLAYHDHGVKGGGFSAEQSVTIFLVTVVGGLGSVSGPLIGALYFGVLTLLSSNPLVVFLATGGGGLLLLLLVPGGLGQLVFDLRDAVLRRVAARHRIVVPSLLADVKESLGVAQAPIAPRTTRSGASAFVPARYRLEERPVTPAMTGDSARG